MKNLRLQLKKGDVNTTNPELSIVPGHSPSLTYIWIGDDDNGCFGTISGMKTLEKLAMSILRELGHKPSLS